MDAITERTLVEFIENGAVESITIREASEGFEVLVSFQWDSQKQARVVTARNREPKIWSSLTRLVQHLSHFENLPPIKLEVKATKHAGKKSTGKRRAG